MDPFYLPGGSHYDASGEVPEASRLLHNMARVDLEEEDDNRQGSRYHHSAAGTRQDEEDDYLQGSRYQNNVATGQSRVHYGHYYGRDITINNTCMCPSR
jgi:3-phenylpropionate/cinnamic acid dioxygenase small subunit